MLLRVVLAGLVFATARVSILEQRTAHMVETAFWTLAACSVVEETRRLPVFGLLAPAVPLRGLFTSIGRIARPGPLGRLRRQGLIRKRERWLRVRPIRVLV